MRVQLLLLMFASLFMGACQTQYIPNTDVADSPRNRDVIEFCETYRRAVERGKVGEILALADPGYYEDGGNIDASDDIDYAGLRDFLETRFRDTVAIRYDVRYRKVSDDPSGLVFVDYTYSASYKIPAPEGERWKRAVGDNRLVLVPYQDTYRIRAGM
ncbi:MAG: hypothetical protein B6A08_08360 [Sorangiineae bacterium NIC37A_2]|jgi:hypothetical protein|nr:MAG: hypothetical protein B6A08_08360 [Sorangiineae bacterium NIC37A_2]